LFWGEDLRRSANKRPPHAIDRSA